MPINVTCPKCQKRFKVSDKFAGQKGPCPQCKTVITVPKLEEQVVIHAPEPTGPKDSKGKAVLQPIFREETKFSPVLTVVIIAATLLTLMIALVLRFNIDPTSPPQLILLLGALALGPPLAAAGYTFLRDFELAPFRGMELWIRAAICGGIYALLWGVFWGLHMYLYQGEPLTMADDMPFLAIVIGGMIGTGGAAGHFTFDLEYLNGVMHYGFYLGVCILLKLVMGLGAI